MDVYTYDRTTVRNLANLERAYRKALFELDDTATALANALDTTFERGGDPERAE